MTLAKQIRTNIIKPTLQITDLWSPSAEILVYGTGMIESNYESLVQMDSPVNGGLGFFQLEPSDFMDLSRSLKNAANKVLLGSILAACYYEMLPVDPRRVISDIKFATLLCRYHYGRVSTRLPDEADAAGLAEYHKTFYNSALGAADVAKNTITFQSIIDGGL